MWAWWQTGSPRDGRGGLARGEPALQGDLAAGGDRDAATEALRRAAGRSNRQIARALFISPKTAGVHVSNILAKLDVHTRVQAAASAWTDAGRRPAAAALRRREQARQ